MKQILSIGMNDKVTKKQEMDDKTALDIIGRTCLEMASGVTIVPGCIGVYTHENGEKVIEKTVRCEFYGETVETVKAIARALCKALNQESIAYEAVEIKSEFIGA